ncbi:MAG: peptide ABC transporter substrate-binding protein [Candidatus Pacebacteria bacterium]|nr:peptide ABC transporter substrate-binding protein [Candidatus Paceibacterota bacterium]
MKHSSDQSLTFFDRFLHRIEGVPASDRSLLRIVLFVVIGAVIWLALAVNQQFSEVVPTRGGSITEGIIGTARFVNPILALTRADQDVTALVYSGLMKIAPDGTLVNDVAESITTSEDGLTYNITLRKDVTFHDGTPLTARDVVYTVHLIQDPDLKSPLRGNWTNVTATEVNEYELTIALDESYAPFIENFTVGIMPAHLWSDLPIEQLPFSQLNTEPIGTGPFQVTAARRDTSGIINHYTLSAYRNSANDPNIDTIELEFFQNEEQLLLALHEKKIDATAYLSPEHIADVIDSGYRLVEEPLPRTFGIFFNQNRSTALRDPAAREALTAALDRNKLIESTLSGYGVPSYAPTAFGSATIESSSSITEATTTTQTEQVIATLESNGWTKNNLGLWEKKIDKENVTLSVTIKTSNTPLFASLVDSITKQWEAIGVQVVTEQFEQTGLVQSVIRPRDFEALLFGLDMSRSYDLYPFWHSSQQNDPGLNVAQYANVEVDKLLEKAHDEQYGPTRLETLQTASTIIVNERPAIFLFQPTFTYVISPNMTVAKMTNLGRPTDRFSNVTQWHTENDSLWPIFRNEL